MEWSTSGTRQNEQNNDIANADAKEHVAKEMAIRLRDADVVGVGSGSTSLLTLYALVDLAAERGLRFTAITTSLEMEITCHQLNVETSSLLQRRPDWSFDGADEIDGALNMIKGRGGAMLRERLVMSSSPERYVVVDRSKIVARLGENASVPLEIVPESLNLVRSLLLDTYAIERLELRPAVPKDGPVITEKGNLILDVKFADVQPALDSTLRSIPGVVATGLFIGFNPKVISA